MINLRYKVSATLVSDYIFADANTLKQLLQDAGYSVELNDIISAWESYSGSMCAGWLCLSENAQSNVENILNYLEVSE